MEFYLKVLGRLFVIGISITLSNSCTTRNSPVELEAPLSSVRTLDIVPTDSMAIVIATNEWLSLFGKKILDKRPFCAILRDSVWLVTPCVSDESCPRDTIVIMNGIPVKFPVSISGGGGPYIEINKFTGEVISIGHGL